MRKNKATPKIKYSDYHKAVDEASYIGQIVLDGLSLWYPKYKLIEIVVPLQVFMRLIPADPCFYTAGHGRPYAERPRFKNLKVSAAGFVFDKHNENTVAARIKLPGTADGFIDVGPYKGFRRGKNQKSKTRATR